jgi:hypothetical protein
MPSIVLSSINGRGSGCQTFELTGFMHPLATVLLSDCTTLTGSGAFVGTGAESFNAKIVNEQKVKKKETTN